MREFITDRNGLERRFDTKLADSGVTPPRISGTTPSEAERMTIASSQNVKNMFFTESGQNTVRTELLRRGRTVAVGTTTVNATPNQVLQVLLVPIISNDGERQTIKTNINNDIAQVRDRMFPFGTANVVWSDDVIRRDGTFTLDNFFNLYNAAPGMDRIRRRHNEDPNRPDAQIVMGIVAPSLVEAGSAPGFAFGADVSKLINTLVLDELDAACDAVNGVVKAITFGLLGSDDGCKLDIPLYVGWMTGAANAGSTLAHEIGHQLGLVKPWAGNGAWLDNVSHSVNDELPFTIECNDTNGMATDLDLGKTFDRQPGVSRPIVDPIGGTEFLPATNDRNPGNGMRAKAMMSYACGRTSSNTFFEPVDVTEMNHPLIPMAADMIKLARTLMGTGGSPSASPAAGSPSPSPAASSSPSAPIRPARAPAAAPDTTGPRIHVFGTLNSTTDTGELVRVESYGEDGPLTPSFATGYWLVQLNAAGNELARTGVAPLGDSEEGPGTATQFVFSATLRRHADTVRLQLRHGDTVLDNFAPGAAIPVVQIVQPATGGFFNAGPVTVAWTATDANGDPLEVSIEYSPDDGASWKSIGSATGSGSLNVPLEGLAVRNGGPGRFRVTASDGLRAANAVSASFGVANQPPQVYIDQSLDSGTVLEGQAVSLLATAVDPEEGPLDGASLRWDSSLDGTIGTGETLSTATLSVGFHTISVYAMDSQGAVNPSTIHLTVAGDYDFDGIGDASEFASALNPLSSTDAFSDADGDGLTLVVERQIGSNPTSADSDGDGRSDSVEFVDGTNSMTVDQPPAADALSTTVSDLALSIDLAADTPLPQFNLGVNSRHPADWHLITDVDWLEATANTGTTPASTLVRVQAYKLADGVHMAHLRFDSATIGDSAIIPLTVTVVNRQAYFDIDENGTADGTDCQAVQALIGLTFDDAGYDVDLDVDRDGIIENEDVGTCQTVVSPTLPGDFDQDGDMDDHDIDLFIPAPFIDFNSDALLNAADSAYLIETIFHTHFGDANLDGFVNRADAAIVSRNLGWNGGPAWARGNFNGDARVDLVDLAIQQANYGASPAPSPAAEIVRSTQSAGRGPAERHGQASRLVSNRQVSRVAPANVSNSPTASPSTLFASRRPRSANRFSRQRLDTIVDELFAESNGP